MLSLGLRLPLSGSGCCPSSSLPPAGGWAGLQPACSPLVFAQSFVLWAGCSALEFFLGKFSLFFPLSLWLSYSWGCYLVSSLRLSSGRSGSILPLSSATCHWEGFLVFENFSFLTPSPGWVSVPNPFVSLFIFYILSCLLSKTMGCISGFLVSSASVQKLFCGICSAFKRSFNEFVGEKVPSPSYSSAILGPLLILKRQPASC